MDVEMSSGDGPTHVHQKAQHQEQPQSSYTTAMSTMSTSTPTPPPPATAPSAATMSASAAQTSFRRQRASRACETCHSRKVRCDAASLGVPCTNCVAFQIECRIPTPKRKKTQGAGNQTGRDSDSDRGDVSEEPVARPPAQAPNAFASRTPSVFHSNHGTPPTSLTEAQARKEEVDNGTYVDLVMKPKFTRAPITEAGRVAYLGESSNLTLLVHDRQGSADVVHYPLPENVRGSRARLTELDNVEIDILHQRGAFLLPPRSLCDELIESYFKWVHPIVPIINRTRFMRQYRDAKNPPSLLLLQAVLLAGTRACNNPQLMDANGSTTPAALTFYKRAKALYDANYEDDRVTIVQSLLLMGWYWEGPEDVTKNVFYWSRVATIVAQGSGMHRSVEQSQLSRSDKRLWKRIWWSLFTRDRSVAVALGRPVHINLDDSDVEMLTEDDFIEDEPDRASEYPPDPIHVQFFLQYVKLCEIMGLVLSQQYSVASKGRQRNAIDLTHSDMALADWLQNCPKIVYWEMPRHHFWSALLHSTYYTTLCLLHRAHMPPGGVTRFPDQNPYPSRNIAFQAAAMITSIVENLAAHDELRYCPAFVVYSLFSALIMHVYQMRSPVPSIQQVTQDRLRSCMQAMKEISKVWLVGKMVYALFESIIGNKVLEERLQRAEGKRHRKMRQALSQLEQQNRHPEATKRKYDDMAIDFAANTPQPQESYERSRPQTPSAPKTENASGMQPPPMASPNVRQQGADTFMGGTNSRPQTRPATPFNPSFSVPPTPPDLYLVTRNSPNISQSLWENFQPDQLFPDNAAMPNLPNLSPVQTHTGLDPNNMGTMPGGNVPGGMHGQSAGQFQPRGQGNGMLAVADRQAIRGSLAPAESMTTPRYDESEVKTPQGADYGNALQMNVATLGDKELGKAGEAGDKPLVKFLWWRVTKKQRLLAILGIVLLLLVVLVLIAWFVIVKAVFQHYVNSVKLSLNYLDVKNITSDSTLGVELSLHAQHDIGLHASTDATTATLLYNGDELGTIEFPALDIAKGEQDYNLTISSYLVITDQEKFNAMAQGLITTAQITLEASATIKAHGGGISYGGLDFNRDLAVSGFDNFANPSPTIDLINWWGCSDDTYTMDINVTLDNVAQMGLNGIGALNLSLYYEQDYLGYATSLYPEAGVPRGESMQVFRAVVPSTSSALKAMVLGVIGKSAQFYISGDNEYVTEYAAFTTALSYVNMSILYTDALAKVELNSSCDILSVLA